MSPDCLHYFLICWSCSKTGKKFIQFRFQRITRRQGKVP